MIRGLSLIVATLLASCATTASKDMRFNAAFVAPDVTGVALEAGGPGEPLATSSSNDIRSNGTAPRTSLTATLESAFGSPSARSSGIDSLVAYPANSEPLAVKSSSSSASRDGLRESRLTAKLGYYSSEDANELDDGWIGSISWMTFFTSLLALEFEAGYLETDGQNGAVLGDLWALPLMLNARANLPVWIIDIYGGLGIGGFYYDLEIGPGSDDGFVLGGNAFLGGTVNLVDKLALGLEAKYYASEDTDLNSALDAFAVMVTLGFGR